MLGAILVMLFFPFRALHAQELLNYSGTYTLGSYTGNANFGYMVSEGDTVLQGKFKMQRSSLDALLSNEDNSFLIEGRFDSDYPSGNWKFEFGEFQSDKQTRVVDYEYRVLVSGVQENAMGRILRGKPDGPWVYEVYTIEDSKVAETLFKSNILFDNGIPQQSFQIKNEAYTLVGRFLRDGLAHDEWTLFSTEDASASESWYFNEGLLQKINMEANGNSKTVDLPNSDGNATKIINLDAAYLKTLNILQSNTEVPAKGPMASLLEENANYFQKLDGILSKLGKSDFLPQFKVKVPYYPLDSLETAMANAIVKDYKAARSISDSLLNDTQLAIVKLSDAEARYWHGVVDAVTREYLDGLQRFVDFKEEGILEYASRDQLFKKIIPRPLEKELRIAFEENDTSKERRFVLANADSFDFNGNSLATIRRIAEYALASLNYVEPLLDKKLSKSRREQQLLVLEKQLLDENKALQALLDTIATSLPIDNSKALRHIKSLTDDQLEEFSNAETLDKAKSLLSCYKSMNKLANTIALLPDMTQTIQEKYTDRIWNPFMANLMDEAVKKRITTSYTKILVPFFLKMAKEQLDCNNVDALDQLITKTNDRLLSLRNEDTAKLERKLKRIKDPNAVLRLFNLPTFGNEN